MATTTDSYYPVQVPNHIKEGGLSTPSHGGTVTTGGEFDLLPTSTPADAIMDTTDNATRDSSPLRASTASSSTTNGIADTPQILSKAPPLDAIAQAPTPPGTPDQSKANAAPVPRPQSTVSTNGSSSRQRPASMPPQAQAAPSSNENRSRSSHQDSHHRSRPTGRVVGSYTLTKTLGAGSMGKVKLAVHNQTGEKV